MKISIGADMKLNVVEHALEWLEKHGHNVSYNGAQSEEAVPWPDVARKVAREVASDEVDEGILFCWTGTGVSIAANKVPGVRAALCADAETARGARLWNKANVLCLSMRLTTEILLEEILEMWFGTAYQPNPSDDQCIALIDKLDQNRKSGGE
jgi:ribose 5-phosphate isomerase B